MLRKKGDMSMTAYSSVVKKNEGEQIHDAYGSVLSTYTRNRHKLLIGYTPIQNDFGVKNIN